MDRGRRAGPGRARSVVVGLVGLALLAACGTGGPAGSDRPRADDGRLTVAFVMGARTDPFFQAMKRGADEHAARRGVDLVWQGDPTQYSPATQIPYVTRVLADAPDALVLVPTDPDALQPLVARAVEAGVLVVNVDTRVSDLSRVLTFITGDNVGGGAAAADALATAIGYVRGGSYQVVVGLTSPTATTNVARLDGFRARLEAAYPGIDIVDTAYSQSEPDTAARNVASWLSGYPELRGIFAIDGTNATGAAAALQDEQLVGKVALVGYDAYPANVELLRRGVFAALVAQDPAREARLAIDAIVDRLAPGSPAASAEREVTIPNVVLTPDSPIADLATYTYVE